MDYMRHTRRHPHHVRFAVLRSAPDVHVCNGHAQHNNGEAPGQVPTDKSTALVNVPEKTPHADLFFFLQTRRRTHREKQQHGVSQQQLNANRRLHPPTARRTDAATRRQRVPTCRR